MPIAARFCISSISATKNRIKKIIFGKNLIKNFEPQMKPQGMGHDQLGKALPIGKMLFCLVFIKNIAHLFVDLIREKPSDVRPNGGAKGGIIDEEVAQALVALPDMPLVIELAEGIGHIDDLRSAEQS